MKFRTILIADDDDHLVKVLEKTFVEKDFQVYKADNGIDAFIQFQTNKPKIILMDIDMPGKTGWEILKKIRKENKIIPIVIMTGRFIEEDSAIKSFEDGATSFIRKSSNYRELVASVDALFRNTYSFEEVLIFGKYTLNISSLSLSTNDVKYRITDREAQLLYLLIKNMNNIVDTKDILSFIWKNDVNSNSQMLRNGIARLNKIFDKNGEVQINSVYGKGYCLEV